MRYKANEISALNKIYNATAKLIKNKDYNDISISEIIKEAGISRSTFYVYFKTKDEILIQICDDIFDHIFSKSLSKEKEHDYSKSLSKDLTHLVEHSFHHFFEDKELILAILNSSGSQIFLSKLRKRIKPLIVNLIESKIIGNNDIMFDIKVHQYVNGFIALIQYYLRHGDNITPEEISKIYFELYK